MCVYNIITYPRSEDSESGLLSRGPVDSSASSGNTFQIHIFRVRYNTIYFFRVLFPKHELYLRMLRMPLARSIPIVPDSVDQRPSPRKTPRSGRRGLLVNEMLISFDTFFFSLIVFPDRTGRTMKRYLRHQVYIVFYGALLFLHVSSGWV